jgi:hypothetical protein
MHKQGLEARSGLECRLGLDSLLDTLVVARDHERMLQGRNGVSAVELANLRMTTLDALVAYAEALDSLAWPVPREVLQQIRLRRSLLSMPHVYAAVDREAARTR